jgi:N-acetyl-alpha-D-glucosaminyl L-malate synthase BshA
MICYPSYGGSGVVATELGKRLAERGHTVHFISYERPFKLDIFHENLLYHEVGVFDYPLFKFPPYSLALTGKIVEVAKWADLDVLHVHYAIPHTVSAYLAKQMLAGSRRLPVVTTLHGTDITVVGHDEQFYDITKFSIEVSDGVTAVSDSLRRQTAEIFEIDREIRTIYNFVDPEEYKPLRCPELRRHFAGEDEKILIHISNFRPVKRVHDVVEIFRRVNEKVPARLLLVGDGPDGPAAHSQVKELGLMDRVRFLGKQERVVELLSMSDIFLLPSEKESFGLVALEAMACEVPVIASDAGGIPETVTDGETGFLFPVGQAADMAEKAVEILQDPDKLRDMGQKGRADAIRRFHIDDIVSSYENYYEEVIKSI